MLNLLRCDFELSTANLYKQTLTIHLKCLIVRAGPDMNMHLWWKTQSLNTTFLLLVLLFAIVFELYHEFAALLLAPAEMFLYPLR